MIIFLFRKTTVFLIGNNNKNKILSHLLRNSMNECVSHHCHRLSTFHSPFANFAGVFLFGIFLLIFSHEVYWNANKGHIIIRRQISMKTLWRQSVVGIIGTLFIYKIHIWYANRQHIFFGGHALSGSAFRAKLEAFSGRWEVCICRWKRNCARKRFEYIIGFSFFGTGRSV